MSDISSTTQPKRAGAEPFVFRGSDTGVLLIHGFLGTPEELRPMGRFLANQGFSVHGVLLARHDGPPSSQFGVRWIEWVASAERELQQMQQQYRRVALVGFSMGALIACHLAARYQVAGAVLLAPALKLHNERYLRLAGIGQYVLPWLYPLWRADFTNPQVQSSVREFMPDADFADPATLDLLRKEVRIPTGALYQLIRLQGVVNRNLWRVTTPLLVLQGRHDRTVMPISAEIAVAKTRSADTSLVWFERSGHMLPNDVEQQQVWSTAANWLLPRTSGR